MKSIKILSLALFLVCYAPAASLAADPLADLLLSGAWCSFSYNQVTGYSNSTRVQFSPNGTYSMGSRGEGYSSGYGGTFGSQSDRGASGYWKAQGGRLFLSEGAGELEPVATRVTQNSNGHPIIIADGIEYSRCD